MTNHYQVKLEALCREDQNKAPGLSVAALLTHPSVLSKLRTIDLRPILLGRVSSIRKFRVQSIYL